jgi:hypothetical protein
MLKRFAYLKRRHDLGIGWADRAEEQAWIAAISTAADRLASDEANFLDRTRVRSVLIEERVTAV